MSNIAYKTPYTLKDYDMWEGDWELIDGDAVAMAPSPFGQHQAIISKVLYQMEKSFEKCPNPCYAYPDVDYVIDDLNVFRPDISILCKKVATRITSTPKMVVEVLSDSTAVKDKTIKFDTYEKEGVLYYLMVDYKQRRVKLYELKDYRYVKTQDKEDGKFEIKLNDCDLEFDIDKWWAAL